ncbi:hypothetical protein G9A89_013219 [Geosiphon pyriformis]|nr:hypothetical protein G9A89_013219 [Geosiphon pyriformis]
MPVIKLETRIEATFQLPRPVGSAFLKCLEGWHDWVTVRVIPNSLHIFSKGKLTEIWRFRAEPIDVSLDALQSNSSHMGSSVLVTTGDGAIWRIQTPVQRKKRNFDSQSDEPLIDHQSQAFLQRQHETFVSKDNQISRVKGPKNVSEVELILRPTTQVNSSNAYKNNASYNSCNLISSDFLPVISSSENVFFETDILLLGSQSGMVYFQPITENAQADPEPIAAFTGEPVAAIYTLYIDDQPTTSSNIMIQEKHHNSMIMVGAYGTINLILVSRPSHDSSPSIICKDYYVSCPVFSSVLFKNRLIIAAQDGQAMLLDFSQNVLVDGKLLPINFIPLELPKNIIRMSCHAQPYLDPHDGLLFILLQDGRLIRVQLSLMSQEKPQALLPINELKRGIKEQLNIIAENSVNQAEIDKIQQLLNSAIISRNLVIHELQAFRKKRKVSKEDQNLPFDFDCLPITIPISSGTITNRTYLKVRLTSRLGIDWSQGWAFIVILNDAIRFQNHNLKNKETVFSYSVGLSDMTSTWERDFEINLRHLQFPVSAKFGMYFTTPFPTYSKYHNGKPRLIYFPIQTLRYDILDFITPCPENLILRFQQQRHFSAHPLLPGFNGPMEGDFFSNKGDFRKAVETLLAKLAKDFKSEKTGSWNELISSLNVGTAYINFNLTSVDIDNTELNAKGKRKADSESAWRRCLCMILGESIEVDQLREIVKSSELAIFQAPLSLEPVFLNLNRVTRNESQENHSQNMLVIQLKITCNSNETLLLVEEALLKRLKDFSNPINDNFPSAEASDIMEVDHLEHDPIALLEIEQMIRSLKTHHHNYVKGSTVGENSTSDKLDQHSSKSLAEFEILLKELMKAIREQGKKIWLPGIVYM